LCNLGFKVTLRVFGGVVFGVLAEVAFVARFGDLSCNVLAAFFDNVA
jgi:hypothetical protein